LVGTQEEVPAPENRPTFWRWEQRLEAPLGGRLPKDLDRIPPVPSLRFVDRIEAESGDEAC